MDTIIKVHIPTQAGQRQLTSWYCCSQLCSQSLPFLF